MNSNDNQESEGNKEVLIVEERNDPAVIGMLLTSWLFLVFNSGIYISEIGLYLSRERFMVIMGGIATLNMLINIIPFYNKQKIDRYIHVLFPVGVFSSIFNMQYNFTFGVVLLALAVLAIIMFVFSITRKYNEKDQFGHIKKLRYPLFAAIIVSLLLSFGFYIFGDKALNSNVQTDSDIQMQDNSMVKHEIEHLKVFVDGSWETLSNEQKVDALQRIVNIECTYLGCEALPIAADTLPDGEGGHYDPIQKKIFIDYELLESNDSEKCVMSVIHEVRHRYQDELVSSINWNFKNAHKLRDLLKANSWKNNYDNYLESSEVGEERYFYQPVEYDAYSYSLTQTEEYFNQMNKFANKTD